MNLEEIEQKTLVYLKQVSNPLVRIDVLHLHLSNELPEDVLSLQELTQFLNQHELLRVMNPLPLDENPGMQAAFDQAGFASQPCVLLDTRMPTTAQMYGMMLEQLNSLNEALGLAIREARDSSDTVRVHDIKKALDRSVSLRERIQSVISAETK